MHALSFLYCSRFGVDTFGRRLSYADRGQSERYRQGIVHLLHYQIIKMSHFFFKSFFIYRTYLLKQYNGIFCKTEFVRIYVYVGRHFGFAELAGNRRRYNGGTVFVSDVVLYDKNGAESALLTAHDGAEVGIVDVSSFYAGIHKVHTPPEEVPVTAPGG